MILDRKVAPPFVQSTRFDLIAPETHTLSNGVELHFVKGGAQDVLKIEVVFKAGRWFEKKWGAAHFTSHLLSKGTRTKSSFEIARLFDLYGAHLEAHPGLDFISMSLYALTKDLAPVLSLFREVLTEATFPVKEIDQIKSIYQQNLKINEEKTSFLAAKHFRKHIFGNDHPYGKEIDHDDVEQLTKDDLQAHFASQFAEPVIFISGKIDKQSDALIQDVFSSWQNGKISAPAFKTPALEISRQRIEKEGSVQSSLRMGTHAVSRDHADYSKVIFTAHLLGGYFGSRLMKNIREEKGLTYGIYASVQPLRHASYLSIGADVNRENIDVAFAEIRKELNRLRTEKVPKDELDTARNHFIGSLQSEINNPFAHADKIKTIQLFKLSSGYYQQMINTIAGMTAEDILHISDKYFNENNFFELAVG